VSPAAPDAKIIRNSTVMVKYIEKKQNQIHPLCTEQCAPSQFETTQFLDNIWSKSFIHNFSNFFSLFKLGIMPRLVNQIQLAICK
jgi:hypothetical protein